MSLRINPWLLTLCLALALPAAVVAGSLLLWGSLGWTADRPGAWWLLAPGLALILVSLAAGALVSAFVAAKSPRGGIGAATLITAAVVATLGQLLLLGWTVWFPLWWAA